MYFDLAAGINQLLGSGLPAGSLPPVSVATLAAKSITVILGEAECPHDYAAAIIAPTCTGEGYTTYTCPDCGESYVDDYVDALGHDWDNGVLATAPAQDTGLVLTYTCLCCHETYSVPASVASGEVVYQQSACFATVSLFDSSGKSVYITNTDADGAYTLAVPLVPAGTLYTLVVTKPGYLSYTVKNLSLGAGEHIEAIDISQLAGDINGDGIVNSIDLTYLLSEFNRAPQLYQYADINGDGLVNSVDLTYLLAGFNKRNVVIDMLDG
jgi:hypothetical protein